MANRERVLLGLPHRAIGQYQLFNRRAQHSICFEPDRFRSKHTNLKILIWKPLNLFFSCQRLIEHLDLIEGVVVDLLLTKWKSFIKKTFYRQIAMFTVYFCIALYVSIVRPAPPFPDCVFPNATTSPAAADNLNTTQMLPSVSPGSVLGEDSLTTLAMNSITTLPPSGMYINLWLFGHLKTWFVYIRIVLNISRQVEVASSTDDGNGEDEEGNDEGEDGGDDEEEGFEGCPEGAEEVIDTCYLHTYDTPVKVVRLLGEITLAIWSIVYIAIAVREFTFLGYKIFFQNMALCPSRVIFLFGCTMLLLCIPFRLSCKNEIEDNISVLAMVCTSMYFLFFCRQV